MSLLPCWPDAVVPLLSIEGQRVFLGETVPLMFNIRFRVKNVNVAESSYSVFQRVWVPAKCSSWTVGPTFWERHLACMRALNQQFQFQYLFCKERREYRQLWEQYISAQTAGEKKQGHVVRFFFTGCCQIHDFVSQVCGNTRPVSQ